MNGKLVNRRKIKRGILSFALMVSMLLQYTVPALADAVDS